MAVVKKDVAPAPEQIHLPADSIAPVGVALSIFFASCGFLFSWIFFVIGLLAALVPLRRWIRLTRSETSKLPLGVPRS